MTSPAELLKAHGIELSDTAPGRHYAACPQCSAQRGKKNHKCLGVTITGNSAYWGCNHCSWTGPEKGNGGREEQLKAHIYRDASGSVRFRKVRNRPGREPRFWLEQPDGRGGWIKGTKSVDTKIIYRANEVAKAIKESRSIAIAEGEKDADRLWSLDIAATTNAHGASEVSKQPKWTKAHSQQLAGADVVVFNDNDGAGFAHAELVCCASSGIAKRVRRLDLALHWPDMPKGADVSDWLDLGHTKEELLALIDTAPDYIAAAPEAAPQQSAPANGDDAELERLARLPPLDYERARKEAGERLGVKRLALLDALVKAKRSELGLDEDDGKQGHAISFPEPEPWPDLVDGAELLDAVAKAIRRHVVLPDHACDAVALWCAHTFLLDRLMISPRLGIRSPTKGCGKTTLLDVVAQLVLKPLSAANISASAVFRVVEAVQPVLLVDEADSFLSEQEELRGILNSGHRRGGSVLRVTGEDLEPRSFSTYGACAIALIGTLPATLSDRSVLIDLTRRKPDEAIEPFRFDRVEHLAELRRKLARWITDNAEAAAATEPQMPALYNRAADNWRGLLSIATVAGADWLARGHRAALAGADIDIDEGSRLELLLGDVRDIFARLETDRIPSADLIEELVKIEPRPWAEYGKSGKPITQNKLARLLKQVGIAPEQIRFGVADSRKGYQLHQFEDAFQRFLPRDGEFKPKQRNNADGTGTSEPFQTETPFSDVSVVKCEKSSNDGHCFAVSVSEGVAGNGDENPEAFPLVCEHCGAPERPDDLCNEVAADGRTHLIHAGCIDDWISGGIPAFLRRSQ